MKKLLCLLLTLCAVLTALPVMGAGAVEEREAFQEYDALYVQEGLVYWLDAFDNSASNTTLDLAGGKWYSKVGEKEATLAGAWLPGEDGGIYYTTEGYDEGFGIDLGIANLPRENYTAEFLAKVTGISTPTPEKYGVGSEQTFAFGPLKMNTYIAPKAEGNESTFAYFGTGEFFYSEGQMNRANTFKDPRYGGNKLWNLGGTSLKVINKDGNAFSPIISTIRVFHETYMDGNGGIASLYTYNLLGNTYSGAVDSTKPQYNTYEPVAENQRFRAFFGCPAQVFSIRIYDRVLSKEETQRNLFVDIAQYYGLDLTWYATLDNVGKAYVEKQLAAVNFETGLEAAQAALAEAEIAYADKLEKDALKAENKEILLEKWKDRPNYDKYYVTEGLTLWLDAFVGYGELNETLDLAGGKWYSKVGDRYATLTGTEYWEVPLDGQGIGYECTKAEYLASLVANVCPIGIELDVSWLPTEAYTLDMVTNIRGLTNRDGTRYVDPADSDHTYGIYTGYSASFSLGIFKAMTFVCTSRALRGTQMGHRWCYTPSEWYQHNGRHPYRDDFTLATRTDGLSPFSYVITMNYTNGGDQHNFRVLLNGESAFEYSSYPQEDPAPEFHLFKGVPATVYAIRLYDRVLNPAERAQNHTADILSYYGFETELFDIVLSCAADKAAFYEQFSSMDFSLEQEEAETLFRACLAGAWIRAAGIAVRKDNAVGLRGEYEMDPSALASLEAAGYKVSAGSLLGFDGLVPTLEENDAKVVFYSTGTGANTNFQTKNGNYAMAVRVEGLNHTISSLTMQFVGFLTLEKDGTETVLYLENTSKAAGDCVLTAYEFFSSDAQNGGRYLKSVYNACYDRRTIQVDATGSDENDGVAAPVKTLDRAYELLLSLLELEAPLDITVELGEGIFRTEETLVLSAEQITQKHFRLHFVGSGPEESVISGNQELQADGFAWVEGTSYYKYQFEKDAEGNYPDFHYFYVNGRIQEVAREGYNRTYEAETLGGGFDAMWQVTELFHGVDPAVVDTPNPSYKLYLPATAFEKVQEADLGTLEFHISIAWYYRVLHIKSVDFADTDENGNIAVYFYPEEFEAWEAQHPMQGHYFWLENALSFVDEPGEYYYDREAGTLYYYPAEDVDMAEATVEIPRTDVLLAFKSVSGVSFEALGFTGTDHYGWRDGSYIGGQASSVTGPYGADSAAAVYGEYTKGFSFTECLFQEIAANAIRLCGTARDLKIESCQFFHIGSTAIHLGSHNGEWVEGVNQNENILITDNYLDDIAFSTRGSVGIYVSVAKDMEISYNTVMNTSYTALSVGWRWSPANWSFGAKWHLYNVKLCYNYFESFMTDQSDGGAIYTLGGNVENDYHDYFNAMYGNLAVYTEKTWDGKGMVMPYYHDGASSNWHTHDNVEILCPGRTVHTPIYLQNISNQLTHNILVEGNEVVGAFKNKEQYFDPGFYFSGEEMEYRIFGTDGNATAVNGKRPSRANADRFLYQQDNYIVDNPNELSGGAVSVMDSCGSSYRMGDSEEIIQRMQAIYDAYYEELGR